VVNLDGYGKKVISIRITIADELLCNVNKEFVGVKIKKKIMKINLKLHNNIDSFGDYPFAIVMGIYHESSEYSK